MGFQFGMFQVLQLLSNKCKSVQLKFSPWWRQEGRRLTTHREIFIEVNVLEYPLNCFSTSSSVWGGRGSSSSQQITPANKASAGGRERRRSMIVS